MADVDGKTIFDEDARLYDRARPGYPHQLVEDVITYSEIPADGRILEIGCGPGKATIQFAKQGYRMLCVEPGPNLVAVAREKCRDYPAVQFEISSFEDWPVEERAFDLAYAASCFHWLKTDTRLLRIASALKPDSTLALFWNRHPGPFTPIFVEMNRAYVEHAPELAWTEEDLRQGINLSEESVNQYVQEIAGSGLFGPVTVKTYPWSKEFTTREYIEVMDTYSRHRALPGEKKRRLYEGVAEIIDRHGGVVERPYLSLLYLARTKQ